MATGAADVARRRPARAPCGPVAPVSAQDVVPCDGVERGRPGKARREKAAEALAEFSNEIGLID